MESQRSSDQYILHNRNNFFFNFFFFFLIPKFVCKRIHVTKITKLIFLEIDSIFCTYQLFFGKMLGVSLRDILIIKTGP